MLGRLLESGRAPERRRGGMTVSAAIHVVLVGGAVWATAGTAKAAKPVPVRAITLFAPPAPMPAQPDNALVAGRGSARGAPKSLLPAVPGRVAVPSVPLPPDCCWLDYVAPLSELGGRGTSGGAGDRAGGSGIEPVADVPAEPVAGNPRPVYPPVLRAAGIEGRVTVRFVVDTTGRVEPQSITVDSSANPLFAASVREALGRARFHPALARGRPVRITMLQEFVFRMERGGKAGNGN